MVPTRSLKLSSRLSRSVSCPSSVGRDPLRAFIAKFNSFKVVIVNISVGIVPLSNEDSRVKIVKFGKLVSFNERGSECGLQHISPWSFSMLVGSDLQEFR